MHLERSSRKHIVLPHESMPVLSNRIEEAKEYEKERIIHVDFSPKQQNSINFGIESLQISHLNSMSVFHTMKQDSKRTHFHGKMNT